MQMGVVYLPLGMWRLCGCQFLQRSASLRKKAGKEDDVVPSGSGTKSAAPFILGESLPPIPAKLVAKIQKGEFVDMAELLRDNIEAGTKDSEWRRVCNSSE